MEINGSTLLIQHILTVIYSFRFLLRNTTNAATQKFDNFYFMPCLIFFFNLETIHKWFMQKIEIFTILCSFNFNWYDLTFYGSLNVNKTTIISNSIIDLCGQQTGKFKIEIRRA